MTLKKVYYENVSEAKIRLLSDQDVTSAWPDKLLTYIPTFKNIIFYGNIRLRDMRQN